MWCHLPRNIDDNGNGDGDKGEDGEDHIKMISSLKYNISSFNPVMLLYVMYSRIALPNIKINDYSSSKYLVNNP